MFRVALLIISILGFQAAPLNAAPPMDAGTKTEMIGDPIALDVVPSSITLDGPRASQQLLVTARYADGSLRDLTRFSVFHLAESGLLSVSDAGLVTGRRGGAMDLEVQVGEQRVRVPVTIRNADAAQPISFRREVMPVLSAAGCSDIRCHGAPSGKNGFRLSLWGSDPDLDYVQLTRDGFGRRTNAFSPSHSLLLMKPLTHVAHAGGKRFAYNSHFYKLLRDWQREGLRDDSQAGGLKSLEIVPAQRVLHAPARWQQLAVRAIYDDGRTADVTRLTAFSSTDLAVAHVDRSGLVEFNRQGEVAILCRFLGKMTSVRLLHIAPPADDYRWPDPPQNNYVDTHVFAKLKLLHIAPS